MLLNPTGGRIRNDVAGSGKYLAPRGQRLHAGIDFSCAPEQNVVAPCDGIFLRIGKVYKGDPRWSLVELSHHGLYKIQLMYVTGRVDLVGTTVSQGDVIGKAQDITIKYTNQGMKPHVHMAVIITPQVLYERKGKLYIHPEVIGVGK